MSNIRRVCGAINERELSLTRAVAHIRANYQWVFSAVRAIVFCLHFLRNVCMVVLHVADRHNTLKLCIIRFISIYSSGIKERRRETENRKVITI